LQFLGPAGQFIDPCVGPLQAGGERLPRLAGLLRFADPAFGLGDRGVTPLELGPELVRAVQGVEAPPGHRRSAPGIAVTQAQQPLLEGGQPARRQGRVQFPSLDPAAVPQVRQQLHHALDRRNEVIPGCIQQGSLNREPAQTLNDGAPRNLLALLKSPEFRPPALLGGCERLSVPPGVAHRIEP